MIVSLFLGIGGVDTSFGKDADLVWQNALLIDAIIRKTRKENRMKNVFTSF